MSNAIIPLTSIEIDVFYDGSTFRYNRRVDGRIEKVDERIPADRARQIIEAHAGGDTRQNGAIDFDNPTPFSWTVSLIESA